MSLPLPLKGLWPLFDRNPEAANQMLSLVIVTSVVTIALTWVAFLNKSSKHPLVNAPGWFQLKMYAQRKFFQNGREIFSQAKETYAKRPFRLITEGCEMIILPSEFAHTIRNEESLSFTKAIASDFHSTVSGFEPFAFIDHDTQLMQKVVRKQLTKYLNTVTEPLASEGTFAVSLIFGEDPEWKEVVIKESLLNLIARLSSRVFLGDELCRNEDWLKITKEYTVDTFIAAAKMSIVPPILKFLLPWFSRECKQVRQKFLRACDVIAPTIEKRRKLKATAEAEGKPIPSFNDAIDWAENEGNGHAFNPATFQLTLSVAAIHTTSELLCQTLLLLSNEPELITSLREEMINVLRNEGWKKTALYNMKLLDSAIKEAQRMKPNALFQMRRWASKDLVLQDGLTIRKGDRIGVDAMNMLSPDVHTNPEKYDIYRFLRMREEPGNANKAQLVATHPDHLSFGHGLHACPGRFFAANEIKIALCHLLLKYDWKIAPGSSVQPRNIGSIISTNPENKLLFRRRKEEIDLESLGFNQSLP